MEIVAAVIGLFGTLVQPIVAWMLSTDTAQGAHALNHGRRRLRLLRLSLFLALIAAGSFVLVSFWSLYQWSHGEVIVVGVVESLKQFGNGYEVTFRTKGWPVQQEVIGEFAQGWDGSAVGKRFLIIGKGYGFDSHFARHIVDAEKLKDIK